MLVDSKSNVGASRVGEVHSASAALLIGAHEFGVSRRRCAIARSYVGQRIGDELGKLRRVRCG